MKSVLVTSIGKRVELINHLKTTFRVIGADASTENAARHFTDGFYQIPRCREAGYVDALLGICRQEHIDCLIPLYEAEFPILAAAREQFLAGGTRLILSGERVLTICKDKRLTADFFAQYAIPAPKTYTTDEMERILAGSVGAFPMLLKPADGMGSEGVHRIDDLESLAYFYRHTEDPIVQSLAIGTEYTIDALCDEQGTPIYLVPRVRLEVRSGEVVKSRSVREGRVLEATKQLLAALNREDRVIGPMTIQCFLSEEGVLSFIEINPRFGGGVPLSFASGADYASALSQMCEGHAWSERTTEEYLADITETTMLRYDQSVFEATV